MPKEHVNSGTADTASVWVSPSQPARPLRSMVTDMLG